ncbi:MAG TPA: S8 family peptidase [Burkholderiaceae bacterium]|nr:S8 family peptidase [Burkholderiaceae bacterium]
MRGWVMQVVVAGLAGLAGLAQAQSTAARSLPRAEPVDQFIVGFRGEAAASVEDRVARLSRKSAAPLSLQRSIAGRLHVLRASRALSGAELEATLAQLRADDAVSWVQPDARKFALALPNDPRYADQWWLRTPGTSGAWPASINAEAAWDISTGSRRVVVAVLDTGVLFDHPDLKRAAAGGKLLPGYDFVSDTAISNDADGRDTDPSDPGDWVSSADKQSPTFTNCDVADSSWHGTHIAGIVGGLSNNSEGVAGIGWSNWVLPVRVLGKCSGRDSDILAAMAWSAGLPVTNGAPAPANTTPARVINLSLGSPGTCSPAYRDLIAQLRARGVSVFAAAGNDSGAVVEPANCPGAIAVGGVRHVGTKVGYSAHGPQVAIAAPAGNCGQLTGPCLYPIISTDNAGTTTPGAMTYDGKLGTSFSTPIAAGVAGLMIAVNPQLPPDKLLERLRAGARAFPAPDATLLMCSSPSFRPDANGDWPNDGQCNCDTSSCGAGLLDARGAVLAALAPIAAIAATTPINTPTAPITLDSRLSVAIAGASVARIQWAFVGAAPAGTTIADPNAAQTTLSFSGPGSVTLRLTVTDSAGRSDTQTCVLSVGTAGAGTQCAVGLPLEIPPQVEPSTPPPVALPPVSGGGGGGGSLPLWLPLLLGAVLWLRRR